MQSTSDSNNLFTSDNFKLVEVNSTSTNKTDMKDFINGIQKVQILLNGLEKSMIKCSKYENQVIRCQSNHHHSHFINEWWDTDASDGDNQYSKKKSSRKYVELSESLSTMSIVYLQFQYEELWKQYESLHQAYSERCRDIYAREYTLTKLKQSVKLSHSKIIKAHETVLSVGDKYLTLKHIRDEQKYRCEKRIYDLNKIVTEVIEGIKQAGLEFDKQVAQYLSEESDSDAALLLTQIKKYNKLYLENLRLKTCIRKLE